MRRPPAGRLTIRNALILGFGLTLSLWLFIGYEFVNRVSEVERQSAGVASRYIFAQDLLSSLRNRLLGTSGVVRDVLLDRDQNPLASAQSELEVRLREIDAAIDAYVPALGSVEERAGLARLRTEAGVFASGMREAVVRNPEGRTNARQFFNTAVLPKRASFLEATENLQAVNRAGFIQYQSELAGIHGAAERQTWRRFALAIFCSLGIAIVAILYSGRLEKALVTQLEKDARNTQSLQDLSTKLITAQEEERRRIARELHDEVGQALTAMKVELVIAQRAIVRSAGSPQLLGAAQAMADSTLHAVRDLSRLLHPAVLDDLGLPDAVDAYLRDFSERYGVKTYLRQEGMAGRLAEGTEVAAYRMIQEALTNVARHARAGSCHVTLSRQDDCLSITIEDDGDGFVLGDGSGPARRTGLGLIGMRERASQLGGRVSIASAPGRGTTIGITIPARPRPQAFEEPPSVPHSSSIQLEPL